MSNSRRERAREALGIAQELRDDEKAIQREENRQKSKARKRERLESDDDYSLIKGIKILMDDFFLDPIIGFFMPGFGDMLTAIMAFPYLYVALVKIHSLPLTMAILFNMLVDMLFGAIPIIGDVVDVFNKSYKKNYRLIVGFVEDDEAIISEVRKKAWKCTLFCVVLAFVVYKLVSWSISLGNVILNFIRGLF